MKAIIYHTNSKQNRSKTIALTYEGDHYQIKGTKKPIKSVPLQMLVYGFKTVMNRTVPLQPLDIDFNKYDDIVLVSPVWAGQVNAFMRQFLRDHPFKDKKVTVVLSCEGGYKNYFKTMEALLDPSNDIIDEIAYVKGVKQ